MHTLLKYVYQFVTLYNLNSLRTLKLALCHAVTLQWYWAPKIRKFCGMLEPGFGIRRFRFHYMFFWRRKWQPIPVSLPGESHGQRNLAGYTPCGCKELDMTKQLTHTHIFFIYLLGKSFNLNWTIDSSGIWE